MCFGLLCVYINYHLWSPYYFSEPQQAQVHNITVKCCIRASVPPIFENKEKPMFKYFGKNYFYTFRFNLEIGQELYSI